MNSNSDSQIENKNSKNNNNEKIEIQIDHNGTVLSLFLLNTDDLMQIRKYASSLFNYSNFNQFDICIGNYELNDLFDELSIKNISDLFLNNKYKIKPCNITSTSNSSSTSTKSLLMSKSNEMEILLKLHNGTIDKYTNLYDLEESSMNCFNDMKLLNADLNKVYEDIVKEQVKMKSDGLMDRYDNLKKEYDEGKSKIKNKKEYLSKCYMRILELKNMEKNAVECVRENKKMMAIFYDNQNKIDYKNKELTKLDNKQKTLFKKKENQKTLLENYIAPTKKNLTLEYIRFRFLRIYKHSFIMKVFNEKNIIVYKPVDTDINIEIKQINDKCHFEVIFKNQAKRIELSLNFNEKLITAIKKKVFIFDYNTGVMCRLKDLAEDHTGGSFVYVPFTNLVYCISGLSSILVEVMQVNKYSEISSDTKWQTLNKLPCSRSYFSTFVQNDTKIYLLLGYSVIDNKYLNSVVKLDTAKINDEWTEIHLKGYLPKLCFSACVPCSDDEVYILGGEDENLTENLIVYFYDLNNGIIEDSSMQLQNIFGENKESRNLFSHENCFIALKHQNEKKSEHKYLMALYDTRNSLHLINVKNFYYFCFEPIIKIEDQITNNEEVDKDDEIGDECMHKEKDKLRKETNQSKDS